jgi:hypothetical protein
MLAFSRRWVSWQLAKNLLIGLAAFGSFFTLYVWRLGTLTPGLSAHEASARAASGSFRKILDNPVNAPHKVMQYIFQLMDYHGAFWMRSATVLFALVFLVSLYMVLRIWFGKVIALAGTLLLATTPWVILIARSATPDIMYLSPLLFISACALLCRTESRRTISWFVFIGSLVICMYTPGVLWLIIATLIIKRKKLVDSILKINGAMVVLGLSALALFLLPLGYAVIKNVAVGKQLLLIPDSFTGLADLINNALGSLSSLGYILPRHVDYAVGRIAILNVAQVVLAAVGFFALWKKAKKEGLSALFLVILALVAATLNNNVVILTLSLPAIAILSAAGLKHLYSKWFSVFPTNPLARWFALTLIFLVLIAHVAYGVRYALLAWPHNMETRKTYVVK